MKGPLSRGDGIVLTRDVTATVVPHGHVMLLLRGTWVRVMQALGGSYTVEYQHQWLWIHEEDADALGLAVLKGEEPEGDEETQIWSLLRRCYDPEIPVNIVDLGLIYHVEWDKDLGKVLIHMTLTAPGCGMGPVLTEDIKKKISRLSWVSFVDIQWVFDPPWTQARMSEEAKLTLGLL